MRFATRREWLKSSSEWSSIIEVLANVAGLTSLAPYSKRRRSILRRVLSVLSAAALMAAMLVALQGPAMAQSFDFNGFDHNGFFDHHNNFDNGFFNNGFEQDIGDTGDVNISTRVSQSGNNSNQCVAPLQFGNTGNLQNAQGFSQFNSFADDIEFDGSSFLFAPEQNVNCGQAVKQSSAAS